MTKAELRAWINARSLTQHDAAKLLGLSRGALVRQLAEGGTATKTVGDQTAIICELRSALDAADQTVVDLVADMDRMQEDENRRYSAG